MRARWHMRILTGALAIMATCVAATFARAAPLDSCAPGNAVYRATTDERYEIEFSRGFGATPGPQKSGVLRYRGRAGPIEYELWTVWPSGYLSVYVMIKGERNAHPESTQWFGSGKAPALSSEMLALDSDFRFHQNNETASPYLVIPDLGQEFYHWPDERARHPAEKIIPPEAWKLVQCRD
jgi:hypothetical protein